MKLEDSRRLTGPNLYAARPGAVAQVTLGSNDDATGIVTRWRAAAVEAAEVLGWGSPRLHVRHFEGPEGIRGVALMIEAGLDQLFTATEVNEWALSLAGLRPEDAEDPLPASFEVVRNNSAEERHRFGPLAALIDAATAAGCPWMVDDERVTLGWGPGACSFEPARAPRLRAYAPCAGTAPAARVLRSYRSRRGSRAAPPRTAHAQIAFFRHFAGSRQHARQPCRQPDSQPCARHCADSCPADSARMRRCGWRGLVDYTLQ